MKSNYLTFSHNLGVIYFHTKDWKVFFCDLHYLFILFLYTVEHYFYKQLLFLYTVEHLKTLGRCI